VSELQVSYSGVRGIVGQSLTEEVARGFGRAFATMVAERADRPTVLLGRDTRPSSLSLLQGVLQGMAGLKGRFLDLGVVPTPTLQFALGAFGAQAGLMVTASHNPHPWNGFKFFLGPDNTVLDGPQTERLFSLYRSEPAPFARNLPVLEDAHEEALRRHLQRVKEQVDVELIRSRRFRVAVDAAGGAGAEPMARLLADLGCEEVEISSPRDSEPLPENLGDLCAAVVARECHFGLAQDLDADRLALVDERGRPPGEEMTLVLVARHLLSRRGGPAVVVKNAFTTRAVNDVARTYGAEVVETRVGEIHLSRALLEQVRQGRFAFGGEGNGGVIYPPVCLGRDSLVGTAFLLESLAARPGQLSEHLASLPAYHAVKKKVALRDREGLESLYLRLEQAWPEARPDRLDGLRLFFPDGSWLGVRPSNTEPVLRLTAESARPDWAQRMLQELLRRAST
jgi:phosphomannomutase